MQTHTKAIIIDEPGDPEVLRWADVPMPEPGEGEILICQKTAGLNYIDICHRQGKFGFDKFPAIPGVEGAGIVEAIGSNCQYGFRVGERVCYAGGPVGAYAQHRVIPEKRLVKIPDNISVELAAGVMVKGLTAHFLVRRTFMVSELATVLIHAAAGGVGLLLCQWCKHIGARVIGTVGSDHKAEIAKQNGCDYPINYRTQNVVEAVKEITEGRGCNVVYDSVGKDTFQTSLDCLMPFGMMVSYGDASGPVPPFDLNELQKRGSLFLTKPSLEHYIKEQHEYLVASSTMLGLVSEGKLKINVHQSYFLKDAAKAHRALENRETTGSAIFYTEA